MLKSFYCATYLIAAAAVHAGRPPAEEPTAKRQRIGEVKSSVMKNLHTHADYRKIEFVTIDRRGLKQDFLHGGGRHVIFVGFTRVINRLLEDLGEETPDDDECLRQFQSGIKMLRNHKLSEDSKLVTHIPFWDSNNVKKVTIVTLPEKTNRYLSDSRPDLITKHLMDGIDDANIFLCVDHYEAAFRMFQALARCMPKYSTKENQAKPATLVYLSCHLELDGALIEQRLDHLAECTQMAAALVDAPPNVLNPTTYKNYVKDVVKGIGGVTMATINYDGIKSRGYGGLEAVGRGAREPPALVILKHEPRDYDGKTPGVALVGKGITFDTGGLALKSKAGMCSMKKDMAGSAGVFGAFVATATHGGLEGGRPLYCLLCLAENAVDKDSFRHDDILQMYSGLTVEINNTDAEGRLVLADGVAHVAKHLSNEVDTVITMATLTGAQAVTGGKLFGCVFSSDEELEGQMVAAGKSSGDYCHPVPFAPEYLLGLFKSECADMKNSASNVRNCGVAAAGSFIWKNFVHANPGYEGKFVHIDMAACATTEKGRGSGYGVGLLTNFLTNPKYPFEHWCDGQC